MFNFLKYRLIYFLISFLVISAGLFSIVKWGYRYSIDFVGGTYLEYRIGDKTYNLREKTLNQKEQDKLISTLEKKMKAKVTVLRLETVGATLGKETINKTVIASLLAVAGILIYMSLAFKGFKYAMAAILAMIHDFLVVIGSYSLLSRFFGAEVDTMFVTAVLTTMSFSVHDTIVIFDKIREYLQTEGKEDIELSSSWRIDNQILYYYSSYWYNYRYLFLAICSNANSGVASKEKKGKEFVKFVKL